MVSFIREALAILTILANVAFLIILASILWEKATGKRWDLTEWVRGQALGVAFFVALVATIGSLFYSEIAGFEPCKLCWFQRILIYPQVVILGLALKKRPPIVFAQATVLSVVGAIIAAYHYLLQIGVAPDITCDAVGASVSCSQRFELAYGYISIPFMALSAFLLMLLVLALGRKANS